MGIGLTLSFITSKSGLLANQENLAVISNNVSKANQASYHRQTPQMTENATIQTTLGYFGTGVRMTAINRNYDAELENSLKQAKGNNSYRQLYNSTISQIEDLLAPGNTNPLSNQVMAFAGNIQKLATNPEDTSSRTALLATAKNLADTMNQSYESLRKLRDSIATNDASGTGYISERLGTIQDLLNEIPDLNDNIASMESNLFLKQTANDLRDQRDALVKEISQYIPITVTEEANHKYTISVHDSTSGTDMVLVDGTAASPSPDPNYLTMTMTAPVAPNVHYTPQIMFHNTAAGTDTAITISPAESGEITSLMDSRKYIADQMDNLSAYANNIVTEVNTLQAAGFDLNGNAGTPMFALNPTVPPAISALGMSVAMTDPKLIAASTVAGENGNGKNMQAIWNKLNQPGIVGTDGDSIMSYANSYIRTISEDISSAQTQADTTNAAENMFQNAVDQASGVDQDQEMTTMLSIQRAYQASAKMISTVDSMFQTVLEIR